jgi:hypothetical protein
MGLRSSEILAQQIELIIKALPNYIPHFCSLSLSLSLSVGFITIKKEREEKRVKESERERERATFYNIKLSRTNVI